MKVIEVINKDGSVEIYDYDRKLTKTMVINLVKDALESKDTKEIRIK